MNGIMKTLKTTPTVMFRTHEISQLRKITLIIKRISQLIVRQHEVIVNSCNTIGR